MECDLDYRHFSSTVRGHIIHRQLHQVVNPFISIDKRNFLNETRANILRNI